MAGRERGASYGSGRGGQVASFSPRAVWPWLIVGALLVLAFFVSRWLFSGDSQKELEPGASQEEDEPGASQKEHERGASQKELERATVRIERVGADGEGLGSGSGSIIREDGLILTNAHVADPTAAGLALQYGDRVVQAPKNLVVSLFVAEDKNAKPTYTADVVALDGYLDVAILQVDGTAEGEPIDPEALDLPTVSLGDSEKLDINDSIRVLGYPGVGGGSITSDPGAVSGFVADSLLDIRRGWIKTSAPIYHGNSGGLAADERGRLIGMPTKVAFEFETRVAGPS